MVDVGTWRRARSAARVAAVLCWLLPGMVAAQQAVPSPRDVLGYDLGERFTDHAGVVRYMERLADAAPQSARLVQYGETVEGRSLVQFIVARSDYMSRLDDILRLNAELTNPDTPPARAAEIIAANPAVVYYSYGVHGNESSSSEAAMWTAYDLLTNAAAVAGVLDSVVVIIDPVANPDGRDRYVNWYRQARGVRPNPNPEAREHWEPWPGGRVNHYLFDLNRDWAWATQAETQARLATWDHFNPQVHVDFHEMSYTSSYFFFPATPPINPLYPSQILEWGEYFGAANAAAFDAAGRAYYTSEGFDLFYPGYGDSWPSLLGAIGMTYEQAGHSRAGLAIERPDGDTLTLAYRATGHRTTGSATLRASAARKSELLSDFARFHRQVDAGLTDILIVPGSESRAAALLELLQRQGIRVERATRAFSASGTPHTGFNRRTNFPEGTLLVRARQPRGRLAVTLLQPEIVLNADYSYDISAWSLPFAFGVEAHSVTRTPDAGWTVAVPTTGASAAVPATNSVVGYLAEPDFERWPAVIRYLEAGGRVRVLAKPFTLQGRDWPAGTLYFPRGNRSDFAALIERSGVSAFAVAATSGRAERGNDLGTEESYDVRVPRIALLAGDGVSANSMGAHWFFLEQTMQLPFDQLPLNRVGSADISAYDVIIATDMGRTALGDRGRDALKAWVEAGGTLIATGSGARGAGADIAGISLRETPAPADSARISRALRGREQREIEGFREQVPGAILPVRLDPAHPLAFGTGVAGDAERLYVLHSGAQVFEPQPAWESAAWFDAELDRVSGVISENNLSRLSRGTWLASRRLGGGKVVLFLDDPVFRHFWYGTFQPYANAILVDY